MTKTKSNKGLSQDRSKVAGGQDYEVSYEKDKLKTTADTIKSAVGKVGNSRKKVEDNIKGQKK